MTAPPQLHLVVAKLRRPIAPPRAVARPRLIARLNEGLAAGRPLTLIAAPAGYGKTMLAVQWAAQVNHPVAWLSLDEADDDPLLFCTYFVAALQTAAPSVGAELAPVLASGRPPPPSVLAAALLNDLAAAGAAPILCILDDFHVIQDPFILTLLESLLMHRPTGLHLALATREDPALPLARLRARNQLTEVRAADLRFSQAEAATLLRDGMGLSLTDPELARLAERTEGWVAGLHLAGLSLQGRSDPSTFIQTLSGSHRFILSYLTEEVLARRPDALPIPLDGMRMYFTRYSPDPLIAALSPAHEGPLAPLERTGEKEARLGDLVFDLVDNQGRTEIVQMRRAFKQREIVVAFNPPLPHLLSLTDGAETSGTFTLRGDPSVGTVTGEYRIKRAGNGVEAQLTPSGGWRPNESKWEVRFLYWAASVFKHWPKTYLWTGSLDLTDPEQVTMQSAWRRTE